jgi:hypothetical protein
MRLKCQECGSTEVFVGEVSVYGTASCFVNAVGSFRRFLAEAKELPNELDLGEPEGPWVCNECGSLEVVDTEPPRSEAVATLHAWLSQIAPGEIRDTSEVERLLAVAWTDLAGDFGGMRPDKLFSRMEDVSWESPLLTFQIERHGATALGSSRAEMQTWTINLEKGTACCESSGYRQLSPRQRPLDVRPMAEEVAALILEHVEDARVKWLDRETVRVNSGVILPKGSAVKMTLANRRKRFRLALAERLAPHGWVQVRANKYQLRRGKESAQCEQFEAGSSGIREKAS